MIIGRRFFVCGCIAAIVVIVCIAPLAHAAGKHATEYRYQLKPDQKIAYSIKIDADLPDSKETLSGNAFYSVKSIDDSSRQAVLTVSGNLAPRSQTKPSDYHGGPRFAGGYSGGQYNMPRQIVIDPQGKVIKNDGDAQLPFLLGNLWNVALEPFPAEQKTSWDVEQPIEISSKHGRIWGLPPSMGYAETNRSGHESTHYSVDSLGGKDITITKKFELVTDEKGDDGPILEQKGEGKIVFDTQSGLIKSVNMKINTRTNQNNTTVRIPITLTAELLSANEAEKMAADRQKEHDAAHAKAMEKLKPKAMDEAEVQVALLELKDREMHVVMKACERLTATPPISSCRKEVTKALELLLNDREHFIRVNAAKALGVWGTKDNVPALSAVANDSDPFVKEAAKASLVSIMNSSEGRNGGRLKMTAPKASEKKSPQQMPEAKSDDSNTSEQKTSESSE